MKKFVNANIYGDPESTEILVEDGRFKAIGTGLGEADEVVDLEGKLVLPPYVDPHLHLDIFSPASAKAMRTFPGLYLKGYSAGVTIKSH